MQRARPMIETDHLPIRLYLPDAFFEAENRDGYQVSKSQKELWAVELDLLNELLSFCQRNNIDVFVGYGTLIGAIRHGGFIPWDDDIDVLMKRKDYDRFCKIAQFEEPYFLQNEYTDLGFSRGFSRLRNSKTTCIQSMEKNMNVSYNQGVFLDILPLNYMPVNSDERIQYGRKLRVLRDRAIAWSTYTFRPTYGGGLLSPLKRAIKHSISFLSVPILRRFNINNPFVKKMDRLALQYDNTDIVGDHWFYEPESDRYCYSASDFNCAVLRKFEMLDVPVPIGFENILCASYGDWRIPSMEANGHGDLIVDCHTPYTEFGKKVN